jgi:transcriptional regulator with XRE-family HTH domain
MNVTQLMTTLVMLRMEQGITQRRLAYLLNTSQGRISDIENLKYTPLISTLQRYAEVVGMSLTLGLTDAPERTVSIPGLSPVSS